MKKAFMIIGAILTAVGIGLLVWTLAAADLDLSNLSTAKYETSTYPIENEIRNIEIRTNEADILFQPSEDGKTSVVIKEQEKVRHSVSEEDGTLKIDVEDHRKWVDHLGFFNNQMTITIYLPLTEYQGIGINTNTGDVIISNEFTFGNAEIVTDTGDIRCNAHFREQCTIKTDTGDINIDGMHAGNLDMSVTTGHIDLHRVECNGTLATKVSTGKIWLTDVNCGALVSNGDTGDITLKNVIAAGSFQIKRDTGDVTFDNSDAAEINVKTSTGDVSGTLRSEKIFFVETSTGKTNVPKTTTGGTCEIKTSTGDVHIEIVEN